MKLLVTTSQSVLLVDCLSGSATPLHRGSGLYYGIARMGGRFAVAARRRSVSSAVPRCREAGCILTFDSAFDLQTVLEAPFPLRDMHQVATVDGHLWITCSYDDMIAIFDGARWERWYPFPLSGDGYDHYHFNTIFIGADEIALLAHNHGSSDVHCFDRRSRAMVRTVPLGVQAHDLWIEDGTLHTCSSIESRLIAANGWSHHTGGFPRGIAITPEARCVGLSALTDRGARDWTSGAIAVCDGAWQPRHYVHLVHEGMVLDMVAVPPSEAAVIERAHPESVAFPLCAQMTDPMLIGT